MAYPQHVEIAVVEHFIGLPYIGTHQRFQQHVKRCEQCGEAHAAEGQCYEYCGDGHKLIHEVSAHMEATAAASVWN